LHSSGDAVITLSITYILGRSPVDKIKQHNFSKYYYNCAKLLIAAIF